MHSFCKTLNTFQSLRHKLHCDELVKAKKQEAKVSTAATQLSSFTHNNSKDGTGASINLRGRGRVRYKVEEEEDEEEQDQDNNFRLNQSYCDRPFSCAWNDKGRTNQILCGHHNQLESSKEQ